tara:strand:- start:1181 stop:4600 length:3420 start_codon:yes stop_codon:yes gene_type:complete
MTKKKFTKNLNVVLYKMKTDKDIKHFLYENYKDDKNDWHNFVCSGEIKGRFLFGRKDLKTLYDKILNNERTRFYGISEKPNQYSMFRLDFDFEEKGINPKPLFSMDKFLNQIIPEIQLELENYIKDFRNEMTDMVLLTKKPYMKNDNTIKHGLHIVAPNLFINKNSFKIIEKKILQKLDGYDSTFSNPWLCYGQGKSVEKGFYVVDKVLTKRGFILEPHIYFRDYVVYDENEKPITFKGDISSYYPRIFSICSNSRPTTELKENLLIESKKNNNNKNNKKFFSDNKDYEIFRENIDEIVDDFILEGDFQTDGNWNDNFLNLTRVNSSVCPIANREHDRRGGYLLIDNKKGLVKFGCYCNEGQPVSICSYKVVEKKEKINININENSKSLDIVAESYSKNKNKYWVGKTYIEIVKDDELVEWVSWIIKNKVHPHCNHLLSVLDREDEIEELVKIDYEKIRSNETISKKNVGDYTDKLNKTDILCIRSNMGTFKTQNLKKTFGKYRRILMTTFRRSLATEFENIFGDYGFRNYEEFDGKIKGDRIICQIDSLHKVRGEFDLVIHDELVGTLLHLHSFVKEKNKVWNAFNYYNKETNKVIVLDALLDKNSIRVMKNTNRKVYVLENTFKTLKDKKFKIITYEKQREAHIQRDILEMSKKGSVFVPTNSKTIGKKLFLFLQKEGVSVGLDDSDNEVNIPSSEWKNYKVFITTPTNIAGISCNDSFDECCPIFTNNSCNAIMASQMMRRVRNIKSDTYYIYNISKHMGGSFPTNYKEICRILNLKDKLHFTLNTNCYDLTKLSVDYKTDKLVENSYFKSFVDHIKKNNMSKKYFYPILRGILEMHGLEEEPEEVILQIKEDERLTEIKKETKELLQNDKKEENIRIANSRDISESEYNFISMKINKTKKEKECITKYKLKTTFNKTEINSEFVDTFKNKISIFKNVCKMNCDDIELTLKNDTTFTYEYLRDKKNTEKLHDTIKIHNQKLLEVNYIIKELGYKNIFSSEIITKFPYDKMYDYLQIKKDYHKILWNTNIDKLNELDKKEKNYKKSIMNFTNSKLKLCGISVKNKHRGKKATTNPEFYISGLDLWKDNNIHIPKNGLQITQSDIEYSKQSFNVFDLLDDYVDNETEHKKLLKTISAK